MNADQLGEIQQTMLHDMRLYQGNHFGSQRKWGSAERKVLASLHARGLVTSEYRYASLTPEGQRVADAIIAEVWKREPIPAGDTIVLVTPCGPHATKALCGGCSDDRGVRWVCHLLGHSDEADTLACAHRHAAGHGQNHDRYN
ncbi:hypothetical protein SEA_CRACKLEWINK_118 [Mycobacterium phage Cracklewink]|uniref:Uncharacterized protein n=1 Tax=Mycobacterium phage Bipper TaxID=1805457 RepID=A0A142F2P6_9CAUD|nr:hypothetical protein KCH39_gp059 [Mycobacterium phage Bipper]AMQ67053.1 hypothetical protein SEA_BIPPER_118 [Mycobacterium phage Bipper]QDF19404.1 hypothetical protein SEA_CRACKLEWINK_118 [Mycobacterium phage Cracklewink]